MSERPTTPIAGEPRRAVYAGSFDPPTNGHLWVIEKGAQIFDELEVAIGVNAKKKYMFSVEERIAMLEAATEPYPNVTVGEFTDKYLVDYASGAGFNFVLRGLRITTDFDDEKRNANVGRMINPDVQTLCLMCPPELEEYSSSMAKGLMGPEGWEKIVSKFVPDFVLDALKQQHEAQA